MRFEIKEKKDAALYLKELIVVSQIKLDRLKEYIKDMENTIKDLEQNQKTSVKSQVYESFNDKIGATSNYITNIFTNESSTNMSYIKFRNHTQKALGNILEEKEIEEMKNELIKVTDEIGSWNFNMKEESLVRTLEAFEQVKKENPYAELFDESGNIQIFKYEYYDINWFRTLNSKAQLFYDSCTPIRQQMKKDYSKLLDKSMRISKSHMKLREY